MRSDSLITSGIAWFSQFSADIFHNIASRLFTVLLGTFPEFLFNPVFSGWVSEVAFFILSLICSFVKNVLPYLSLLLVNLSL